MNGALLTRVNFMILANCRDLRPTRYHGCSPNKAGNYILHGCFRQYGLIQWLTDTIQGRKQENCRNIEAAWRLHDFGKINLSTYTVSLARS